jgi:hypothetical protein
MPRFTGSARMVRDIIKPYGLHLEQSRKHTWVVDAEGNRVISMSTTPSDRNGHKNTVRWLIKLGRIPNKRYW